MFKLFGFYGKNKLEEVGDKATELLAKIDAEGLTEAAIDEMDSKLNDLLKEVASARIDYNKEKAEADQAQKNYDQKLKAAEILLGQGKEDKANKLIAELEEYAPEVDREKEEAELAKQMLEQLELASKDMANELKNARKTFAKAKQDMKRAELDADRNKKLQERAEIASGLKKNSDSMSAALKAMNGAAEKSRTSADASKLKADLLSTPKSDDDDDIKAALQEASGTVVASNASASDRLAALRK